MKLRHVGITVVDAKESLEFYHGLLGFKIQKDMEESGDYIDNFSGEEGIRVRTIKMSGSDGSLIELLEYHSHPSSKPIRRSITEVGCSHFALTVDDLDNLYFVTLTKPSGGTGTATKTVTLQEVLQQIVEQTPAVYNNL